MCAVMEFRTIGHGAYVLPYCSMVKVLGERAVEPEAW